MGAQKCNQMKQIPTLSAQFQNPIEKSQKQTRKPMVMTWNGTTSESGNIGMTRHRKKTEKKRKKNKNKNKNKKTPTQRIKLTR